MKKNMILIVLMVFFLACETGTRYDTNATRETVPKHEPKSGLVDRDNFEALLDDENKEVQGAPYYDDREPVITEVIEKEPEVNDEVDTFTSAVITDGLEVRKIREGKHEGYIRLVFDVYDDGKPATVVGHYDAKHNNSKKDIAIILHGYQKFSAPLPSFPYSSVIEQIYFEQYPENKGFKFHIKLRENAKVKIFELKNPARLVFDIKAI